jgi:hypothetical protein
MAEVLQAPQRVMPGGLRLCFPWLVDKQALSTLHSPQGRAGWMATPWKTSERNPAMVIQAPRFQVVPSGPTFTDLGLAEVVATQSAWLTPQL